MEESISISGERAVGRVPLEVAIPGGLKKNLEKLGQPDGPTGDFIRLVRMKQRYMDGVQRDPAPVEWVEEGNPDLIL